jgi:hypothetical protein
MAVRPVPPELTRFLAPFSDDVQEIALGLRGRVLALIPDAQFVWDATNAVSLVYARPRDGKTAWLTSRRTRSA